MVTMVSCALSRDLMQNEALLPLTKRWQGSLDGSIPFAGSVIMQSVWWVHGFLADPTVQDMETLVEGGAASWALGDVYIRPQASTGDSAPRHLEASSLLNLIEDALVRSRQIQLPAVLCA
jgi:hypothetical protein